MIKVGVADYGLNVWCGAMYDYQDRLMMLKNLGYDGIERLEASNGIKAVESNALARKLGMDFATCRSVNSADTLVLAAGLGKQYVWSESQATDFDVFCRQVNYQVEAAAKYGVKVGLHNHLGLTVETEEQTEEFLKRCPQCGLILDVGHMAGAYGDPLKIAEKYTDRLVAVHFKDYVIKNPDAELWGQRLRFCELGVGVMGDLNREIASVLLKKNYNGWVFVEHDTHLREPSEDLRISREYLKSCGI